MEYCRYKTSVEDDPFKLKKIQFELQLKEIHIELIQFELFGFVLNNIT